MDINDYNEFRSMLMNDSKFQNFIEIFVKTIILNMEVEREQFRMQQRSELLKCLKIKKGENNV